MKRSQAIELMDRPDLPADVWNAEHLDLDRIHRILGTQRILLETLKSDPRGVHRLLDLGCGRGTLMKAIQREMGAECIGIDLRPPQSYAGLSFLEADIVADPLPAADTAIAVCVLHHFNEHQALQMIRNAGRSVRRLVIFDLVRSWIPAVLFRVLVAPILHPASAEDGKTSIRRAYKVAEMRSLVHRALRGSGAKFRHYSSPLASWQIVDIKWPHPTPSATHPGYSEDAAGRG